MELFFFSNLMILFILCIIFFPITIFDGVLATQSPGPIFESISNIQKMGDTIDRCALDIAEHLK